MKFDVNEGIALVAVAALAACALYWMPGDGGKEIALAAVAGIVGYISRAAMN